MLELLRGGPISASSIPGPPIVNGEAPLGIVGRLKVLGGVLLVVVVLVMFLSWGIAEVLVIFMIELPVIVLLTIGVVLKIIVLLIVAFIGGMGLKIGIVELIT